MILKSTISRIALLFFFVNFIFSCENIENTNQERSKININSDWLYLENNTTESDDALKQKDWQPINLPHTWNALDATDLEPGYRRTGSWYKKDLEIPTIVTGQIYQLYFEGVNITSEVYVNGKKVGGHIGGYIGFTIDITDAISKGNNEVLVRADNGYDPEIIPSQKSDFFRSKNNFAINTVTKNS